MEFPITGGAVTIGPDLPQSPEQAYRSCQTHFNDMRHVPTPGFPNADAND